jgi:hypothetical protein
MTPTRLLLASWTAARYKAALKLGIAQALVRVAVGLTPAQIKAYRIADNQTAALQVSAYRTDRRAGPAGPRRSTQLSRKREALVRLKGPTGA